MEIGSYCPPSVREQGLLQRELPDGMLVYDEERHQAHSLNQSAALIWRHCDGKTSVPQLASLLHQELSLPADEALVWLALDRLEKARLLSGTLVRPALAAAVTRRSVIRQLSLAGALAVLVPLVDSMKAPAAAKQKSEKCNNGLGNGVDCQPPGDPKPNDISGIPGSPHS